MKTLVRILFSIYLIVLAYLYFGLPNIPEELPKEFIGIPLDKIAHFIAMIPMPIGIYLSFVKENKWFTLFYSLLFGVLLATIFENIQQFVNPLRETDIMDLTANVLSIILSSGIMSIIISCRSRRSN